MTTRKPKPPNPATATSASKVVSLRETSPSIEPEEGWTKATAEGEHLIAGHGDGDRRLVQLSTVFRWAVDRSDAPPSVALEKALALVAGIPTGALYLVQKEGWPATFTEDQELPGFGGAGYVDLNASPPPPHGCGIEALVALMRAVWVNEQKGQISTGPGWWLDELPGAHEYLCRFAVSFPVAHSLWGWGRVAAPAVDVAANPADATHAIPTTWAELVPYHKANPGHAWTVGLKNIVSNEKIRRSNAQHKGVAKAMAAELAVTESMVNQLIAKKDEIGSRQAVVNRRTGTR